MAVQHLSINTFEVRKTVEKAQSACVLNTGFLVKVWNNMGNCLCEVDKKEALRTADTGHSTRDAVVEELFRMAA
jgi:hypothetical protein